MNPHSLLRPALLIGAFAGVFSAHALTLDIDGLPTGMSDNPGSSIPAANRLSNQFLAQDVLVSSTGGYAAVVVDNGSGTDWARNMPGVRQGLGGSNPGGTLDFSVPITFTFVSSIDGMTPFVTNAFSLYTDWYGVGSVVSLTAYDLAGNVVALDRHAELSGQNDFGTPYSVSGANIHSVVFQGAGTQAISNVQFAQPTAIAPVPEPASVAALGLGALALLRRRRA